MDPLSDRHEAVFVQRYAWLRGWALRLSDGDHLEADDLLHNAFLQFVLGRRELSEIDNLEAYLYGLLRRLRLSSTRKIQRRREDPLAFDGDAGEPRTPGADASQLVEVGDELRAVCEYACVRKETSKAGSVLLLRFIHGYYPKEIARILRSSLRLANDWLRIARQEARAYLENPPARDSVVASDAAGAVSVVDALRARIRQARTGACLTDADLRRLYDDPPDDSVPASTLSHVVSCAVCLDRVTRHLGLTNYVERDPLDMLGPDTGWRHGGQPHALRRRVRLVRSAACIAIVGAAMTVWLAVPWRTTAVSASELLRSARTSEQVLLTAPGHVVHQVLLLEERSVPERIVRGRRRVEVWKDGVGGTTVRRLYDERSQLTAGEWTTADGTRTLYRPNAAPQPVSGDAVDHDMVWTWEPSAAHFTQLAGPLTSTAVEPDAAGYIVRYRSAAPRGVVEATATIRKADMHVVSQSLVVRDDQETREYVFTEVALASVASEEVPATAFAPEPELLPRAAIVAEPSSYTPAATKVPDVAVVAPDADHIQTELDALVAMHRKEVPEFGADAMAIELIELGRLTTLWTPEKLAALDVDRTVAWLDLVRDHARRFRRIVLPTVRLLEPTAALNDTSARPPDEAVPIRSTDDVRAAVAFLLEHALRRDSASRRAAEAQAAWFDEPWIVETKAPPATTSPPRIR